MTNFEYYKEEFLKLAKKGIDPVVTIDGHGDECIWSDESVWGLEGEYITCNAIRYIWGYSEYKTHRAVEINLDGLKSVLTEE